MLDFFRRRLSTARTVRQLGGSWRNACRALLTGRSGKFLMRPKW